MKAQLIQATGEHEFEPVHGLPGELPPGETLLWQGSPDWRALAAQAFHWRKVAAYFGVMLLWRGASHWADGAGPAGTALAMAWPLPLALACLGMLGLLAWMSASTTVYSITNRRVVMRVGIVLSVTFNLPLRQIATASLRPRRDGTADIALQLVEAQRIAYLHLWPHVRPWRLKRTEPMLRALPQADAVAQVLAQALQSTMAPAQVGAASVATVPGQPLPEPSVRPAMRPVVLGQTAPKANPAAGWPAAA